METPNKKILCLVVLLILLPATKAVDECLSLTPTRSSWTRSCRQNQFISSLDTVYRQHERDRLWKICCRSLQLTQAELSSVTCNGWTGYQNAHWARFDFRCPGNSFMTGISSCHNNTIDDRRFQFMCCQVPGSTMTNCENWGVNGMFHARSTFRVDNDRVMTGMNSFYSDRFRK